jgi:hypothetical protein
MQTFQVYFRSDAQWGRRDIVAADPAKALEIARKLGEDYPDELDYYEACDCPINEIEVCDKEYNQLAVWHDDELRVRLAARDLLQAAEKAVSCWRRGGKMASALRDLEIAVAKASEGAG